MVVAEDHHILLQALLLVAAEAQHHLRLLAVLHQEVLLHRWEAAQAHHQEAQVQAQARQAQVRVRQEDNSYLHIFASLKRLAFL